MIYLDWAATAIPRGKEIQDACTKACAFFANPSSPHFLGKNARGLLEAARKEIAAALGVKASTVFFTSGGTEANHIPLLSVLTSVKPCSVAVSALEHDAVIKQAEVLERRGYRVLKIPSDNRGFITPEAVLKTISEDTAFVSVTAVNNEIGSIQPIAEIGAALAQYSKSRRNIHFHTDAVQAIGKIPFSLNTLSVHSAAFSGHKIGAMRGIGLLYLDKKIDGFIRGGGHEAGMRPGTENLAGILSLLECLKQCADGTGINGFKVENENSLKTAQNLNNFLINSLLETEQVEIIPSARLKEPERYSPWILQFACRKIPGEVLVRCLSGQDICISTGSACSSKKNGRRVLKSINAQNDITLNAVRVSIGRSTTVEELKTFISILKAVLADF